MTVRLRQINDRVPKDKAYAQTSSAAEMARDQQSTRLNGRQVCLRRVCLCARGSVWRLSCTRASAVLAHSLPTAAALLPKCRFAAPRRGARRLRSVCLFAWLQVSLTSLTEHFNEDPHPQRIRAVQMSPQTVELNAQAHAFTRLHAHASPSRRHRVPLDSGLLFVHSVGTLRTVMVCGGCAGAGALSGAVAARRPWRIYSDHLPPLQQ